MLTELFPRAHPRFVSPRVLGSVVDGFAAWLVGHGYARSSVRQHVRCTRRIDRALRHRGFGQLGEFTADDLRACALADSPRDVRLAAAVRA